MIEEYANIIESCVLDPQGWTCLQLLDKFKTEHKNPIGRQISSILQSEIDLLEDEAYRKERKWQD